MEAWVKPWAKQLPWAKAVALPWAKVVEITNSSPWARRTTNFLNFDDILDCQEHHPINYINDRVIKDILEVEKVGFVSDP